MKVLARNVEVGDVLVLRGEFDVWFTVTEIECTQSGCLFRWEGAEGVDGATRATQDVVEVAREAAGIAALVEWTQFQ